MNATQAITRGTRHRALHVLRRGERTDQLPRLARRKAMALAAGRPRAPRLTRLRRMRRRATVSLGEIAERAYEIWLTERGTSRLSHSHWRKAIDEIRREHGTA